MSEPNSQAAEFDAAVRVARGDSPEPAPAETTTEKAEPAAPAEPAATEAKAAEPAPEPAKSGDSQPAAPAPAAAAFDAGRLPPEAKAHLTALEDRARRAEAKANEWSGRVPGLQRQLAETTNRLAALEKGAAGKSASVSGQPAPATPASASAPAVAEFDSPEWKAFERDLPEEAKAIKAQMAHLAQRLEQRIVALDQRLNQDVNPRLGLVDSILAERDEQEFRAEQKALTEKHPDWLQHIALDPQGNPTRMSEPFRAWFEEQPNAVRQLLRSTEAKDADWLMTRFKQDTQIAAPAVASNAPPASPATEDPDRSRRRENLLRGVPPSVTSPGVARVDPATLSASERFDYDMREARRRLGLSN